MDVLRQGSVRMKSRRFGVYRRCWLMLKKASSKGPWRLERFADERSALIQGPLKVLELNAACFALRRCKGARKRSVAVSCLDGTVRIFSCDSEREAEAWCKVLSQGELGLTFGVGRGEPDLLVTGAQREQQERFPVILLPSSALDVSGACRLQIAPEHIHLWDSGDPLRRLLSWPLSSLRRYGRDASHFTFEAGRSCHTGEGLFTFETPLGEQIYQHVHAATLAIAVQQQRCREQLEAQGQAERLATRPAVMLPRSAYWWHITQQHRNRGRAIHQCSMYLKWMLNWTSYLPVLLCGR
uniref:Docking protein 4 n=1 Tax=Eptatretus burgeri TaxID=7764 RepID=A0A8C4Q1G7_EPTBU